MGAVVWLGTAGQSKPCCMTKLVHRQLTEVLGPDAFGDEVDAVGVRPEPTVDARLGAQLDPSHRGVVFRLPNNLGFVAVSHWVPIETQSIGNAAAGVFLPVADSASDIVALRNRKSRVDPEKGIDPARTASTVREGSGNGRARR